MQIKSVFCYLENERFKEDRRYGIAVDSEELCLCLNSLEEEIVAKVAECKYLTPEQIQEFEKLAGRIVDENVLDEILFKLEIRRVLTRYKMYIPNKEDTIIFYGLNFWGMIKARQELGILLHKGICWYPKKEHVKRGIPKEMASDVKRILMGNQVLLGLLKSGVPMKRYGVMETFRAIGDNPAPSLVRTTNNVVLDDTSILAFEVVRTYSTSFLEAVSKVERYHQLLHDKNYLKQNYHNHIEFPQIIFVVENEDHAKKLKRYLQERGVWNLEGVTLLFTEDLLMFQDVKYSIYELDDNNEKIWYELPTVQEV